MKRTILAWLGLIAFLQIRATTLVVYPAPEGAEAAPEYELVVNGKPVFVYNTRNAAKSNQTVYIEGGAIVRGHFMTNQGLII